MTQEITAKQIHEDFNNAEERLYVEAIGLSKSVLTSMNDKSGRLKKLGFGKSKPVKDCEQKEAKRKISGHIIHVIEYFRTYYPHHKFITEEEVKRLCEKYGLLLGETSNYIGDVPEKNLRDIENFKLRKEDWKEKISFSWYDSARRNPIDEWQVGIDPIYTPSGILGYIRSETRAREIEHERDILNDYYRKALFQSSFNRFLIDEKDVKEKKEYEQPLFKICAPKQDFQTSGWEIREGYKLVYDPIVLQPVSKEGIEGYLIVTAWGDEASDEIVVNEAKN